MDVEDRLLQMIREGYIPTKEHRDLRNEAVKTSQGKVTCVWGDRGGERKGMYHLFI